MNFFDTITIATVGLTTIAVVVILLTNLFDLTKDSLSRMSIEVETIDNDNEAQDDDEAIETDDKTTQTDNTVEPSTVEPSTVEPSTVEPSTSNTENQKDPNTWYNSADGLTRYKGEWKNGLPNGKGIKEFFGTASKDPSIIEGNFVDGFAHGHCVQRFERTWEKTAPYYVGEFYKNNYHGFGEYHYGDYTSYKGEWRNGRSHGQGKEYSIILNKTWVGTFCNDKKGVGKWVDGRL
jgi:hypothetical protein